MADLTVSAKLVSEGVGLPPVWLRKFRSATGWLQRWCCSPLSVADAGDLIDLSDQTRAGLLRQLAMWAGDDGKAQAYWGIQTTENTFALWRACKGGGFPGGAEHVHTFNGTSLAAILEHIGRNCAIRRALRPDVEIKPGTLAELVHCGSYWKLRCGENVHRWSAPHKHPHGPIIPALADVTDPTEAEKVIYGEVCA